MLERVYFISQQTAAKTHVTAIEEALEAGCKLVQLRVKNQPETVVLELAKVAKTLCDRFNAKLIINDYPLVARSVNAWGVHVGLQDMAVRDVRAIVGRDMIVGGTANTFEHIQQRILEGVDYVGLGPFRFTTTKEKLSPVLGLEGYQRIMDRMRATAYYTPIVAIGGILPDDVPGLRDAGVYGVAVSGALTNAVDQKAQVEKINALYS
ncbi:thiamine-phosphate diphosphorylase [Niastella koreensis]|uniref:Thiamine-phosphate synthase n=2 Tax=Niastella koreensis TaxID=354356 RepID=G8TNF7_NIAKG|nr:thiamine phosphate synthase [Niastella koreensis]AEV99874.1 thiamine-phosphate diphosphorylase [Niastella koreensis GR20-10]OQP51512.1 thiamine-phosphate diphosphorylase [Niastella koreensis]